MNGINNNIVDDYLKFSESKVNLIDFLFFMNILATKPCHTYYIHKLF